MLVYSNYLSLEGKDAYKKVFSALAGWIKHKTGEQINPADLRCKNSFEVNGLWVSTEKADVKEPFLYSIIIKHSDREVKGRQWIVEVGIETINDVSNFSCVLKTDEISSLITSEVMATRPLFIKYIVENCVLSKGAPGIEEKLLEDDSDTYRALRYEVDRPGRNYPLVLVSPNRDGSYLVNTRRLQEQLVGLAQVVVVPPDADTYEMEENLGRYYSAWDGAINILYPPFKDGRVHGKLLLSHAIENVGDNIQSRISYILAIITHNTNIPNLRRQIRPEGVKAKSLKEKYITHTAGSSEADAKYRKDIDELLEIAASQEEQYKSNLERMELEKLSTEEERDIFEGKLQSANHKIDCLLQQLDSSGTLDESSDTKLLFDCCSRSDEPSLEESLSLIKDNFSNSCTVLDSAIDSARNASKFKKGRRFLHVINRLINEYLPLYLDGGDNKARHIFTPNEYSANESETVTSNAKLLACRTFNYKGNIVQMLQHLKVGVANNIEHTIRVHFLIDRDEKKVVIGYCGEHLPISSH